MKKAKATLKKSNNIKNKSKGGASPLVGRVKKLAKGLVKAMAPKSAKKPLAKNPPKAAIDKNAHLKGARKSALPPSGLASKSANTAQAHKALSKKDLGKSTKPPKEKAVDNNKGSQNTKGKLPLVVVTKGAPSAAPAVLTKGVKVKGEPKSKTSKLSAAQLAEHLEKMCRETGCENLASTKGYCRLDYIKNWKKIKRKEMILKEGKLNQYIEELVSKYPEKYIDVIRQDLQTEVNFNKVIHDLELDESIDDLDYDGDSIDALIGGIKKDTEDFGEDDF